MERRIRRLGAWRRRPLKGFAFACGSVLLAFWARMAVDHVLPPGYPYLTFFPAVILSAFVGGLMPGVAAAAACGLLAWYFFIPPFDSFGLDGRSVLALGFYVLIVTVDLALIELMHGALDRLDKERARSAALAEQQSLLFTELQHRVSNNLQLTGSLLHLQGMRLTDPDARRALAEASDRLALLGRIHRSLHDPLGAPVRFGRFLDDLCRDVIDASGAKGVSCEVEADDAPLHTDHAVPIALIVTELISNALEHGFVGSGVGRIRVALRHEEAALRLTVRDDGRGLPPDFAMDNGQSLGLRIIRSLVAQLDGRLEFDSDGGTVARIVMPAPR
ncbi:DUF4118 domain-containing protein [Azospirillum sp. RWY-5-1]|uniref:histidine kinase n=2 Tax=Azospirillum oleiclasticum TaxID=2735135 RepID=A0ABX2T921_9PROT|nr:DUF4118 domain-containing protein [Azospirillum oleiclasticum]NYZ19638.1 DUF4118 domain-containing protein [Azospirillum oleiclasticum]